MRHHDECAVVASERGSSCSTASRSRWFVGSSRSRRLTLRACSSARCARVRSPGDRVDQGRPTWSAPRPNFARSVRASTGASAVTSTNASRRVRLAVLDPLLPDRPDDRCAPDLPRSRGERERAANRVQERRLAAAVAAGQRQTLAGDEVEVDRPEREGAARDDRPGQAGDDGSGACSRTQPEVELPGLERLLGQRRCGRAACSACRTLVIRAWVPRRSAFAPPARACVPRSASSVVSSRRRSCACSNRT